MWKQVHEVEHPTTIIMKFSELAFKIQYTHARDAHSSLLLLRPLYYVHEMNRHGQTQTNSTKHFRSSYQTYHHTLRVGDCTTHTSSLARMS